VVELTPYVDFVARIENDGMTPILRSVEVIDRSGSWDSIARRFAQQQPQAQDFPRAHAPLSLRPLPSEAVSAMAFSPVRRKVLLDMAQLCGENSEVLSGPVAQHLKAHLPCHLELDASPACPVTGDLDMRRLTGIPAQWGETDFCYVYQWQTESDDDPLKTKVFSKAASYSAREGFPAIVELLKYGGFAYIDSVSGRVTAASCISRRPGTGMLQFGPRRPLPSGPHAELAGGGHWRPVTLGRLQAAKRYVWMHPGERRAEEPLGGAHGAFAYELEDGNAWIFPVSPFQQDSGRRSSRYMKKPIP